jgi:hypothetical protein
VRRPVAGWVASSQVAPPDCTPRWGFARPGRHRHTPLSSADLNLRIERKGGRLLNNRRGGGAGLDDY